MFCQRLPIFSKYSWHTIFNHLLFASSSIYFLSSYFGFGCLCCVSPKWPFPAQLVSWQCPPAHCTLPIALLFTVFAPNLLTLLQWNASCPLNCFSQYFNAIIPQNFILSCVVYQFGCHHMVKLSTRQKPLFRQNFINTQLSSAVVQHPQFFVLILIYG